MELSTEDSLRLNVLVQNAEAIRIDENNMVVYGLSGEREMKAPLNPNCRADKYLTLVREALAGAVLDSPGGYPVFLRRWTRMGQIDNAQIDRLLKLGEAEAVMAVVCSPALTDDLARRAWWVAPYSEYARRMLHHARVAGGAMGPVLAEHLVEHLPFETEHRDMLETVRLVLQPGLIDEERRRRLWDAGRSRKTYRVGFLATVADDLPDPLPPRADFAERGPALAEMAQSGNRYAALLHRVLDGRGQTFLEVAEDAMRRPADQEVVSALLNAIGSYFAAGRVGEERLRGIEEVEQAAERAFEADDEALSVLREALPALEPELRAALFLAHVSEHAATPVFAVTDAVGTVMRKKLAPVLEPIQRRFGVLRGTG